MDTYISRQTSYSKNGGNTHGVGERARRVLGSRLKPGRILYEINVMAEKRARRAIEIAASKMPIKTQFITYKSKNGNRSQKSLESKKQL